MFRAANVKSAEDIEAIRDALDDSLPDLSGLRDLIRS